MLKGTFFKSKNVGINLARIDSQSLNIEKWFTLKKMILSFGIPFLLFYRFIKIPYMKPKVTEEPPIRHN